MNARKMLSVLTIGGIIVLAGPPPAAKAVSPIDPNPFWASFGKMTTEVSSRSHVKHRQWRHRGGRHPFYGSGH
ncbi:hypothetical protein SAMN05444158_3079 [Bradyrhizobium canariense]|uniref:Uncharacterized protein n=1 Tax=Bradyrhizobium canariense TaxID=255045 RepID=A0A1H1UT54_9BRAD|nr:hypothetical protein SAMN05444158_3079 [Bradyrhizobium canariense]